VWSRMSSRLVLLLACLSSLGCSGKVSPEARADSGTSTGDAGTPSSRTIGALTTAEKAALCDWTAAKFGGYGKSITCAGDIGTGGPESRDDCLRNWPTDACTATVTQYESCVDVITRDPCAFAYNSAPECAALRACEKGEPVPVEEPPPLPDDAG